MIDECYSSASVAGGKYIGGFCGYNDKGVIKDCYSSGEVICYDRFAGGFCGVNMGSLISCFLDIELSGMSVGVMDGNEVLCRTTAEMQMASTFAAAEWDLSRAWQMDGFPVLRRFVQGGEITLMSIGVFGPSRVDEGERAAYSCIATYSDGSTGNISDSARWSEDSSFAQIDEFGTLGSLSVSSNQSVTVSVRYQEGGIVKSNSMAVLIKNVSGFCLYGGGNGTVDDPYVLVSKEDLLYLSVCNADLNKHFSLMADIDLAGERFSKAVVAPAGLSFTGSFDGNGHVIRNLTIDTLRKDNYCLGFIGVMEGDSSRISNLGVVNVSIIGGGCSYYAGAVCAYLTEGSEIYNCYSTGTVSAKRSCGGLCGSNYHTFIREYWTSCSVSGTEFVGGLCGLNNSLIWQCYSTGSVVGLDYSSFVGGLCGRLYRGDTKFCYSTGSVTVGGNSKNAGGFCGNFEGGYMGECYSLGAVVAGEGSAYVGGYCGLRDPTSSINSFCCWNIETSGMTTSSGGSGLTTAEMQLQSTYANNGWDFGVESVNGSEYAWYMDGYPSLRCFNPPGTYAYWLMNNSAIPVGLRAESDIPADDNIPNLLKYACGLPAMDACTTADLISIQPADSNTFSVLYYKSKTVVDVILQPIWGGSLSGTWNVVDIVEKLGEDADHEQWRASIPIAESGFIRLRTTAE